MQERTLSTVSSKAQQAHTLSRNVLRFTLSAICSALFVPSPVKNLSSPCHHHRLHNQPQPQRAAPGLYAFRPIHGASAQFMAQTPIRGPDTNSWPRPQSMNQAPIHGPGPNPWPRPQSMALAPMHLPEPAGCSSLSMPARSALSALTVASGQKWHARHAFWS